MHETRGELGGGLCSLPHSRTRTHTLSLSHTHTSCTQLIRRNDELALLYEKIKIQQSTLSKGQIQYRDRLNEIRVLKIKLNDLKRELHILKSSVANIDVLKKEVHQLGRELLQERTKVKVSSGRQPKSFSWLPWGVEGRGWSSWPMGSRGLWMDGLSRPVHVGLSPQLRLRITAQPR